MNYTIHSKHLTFIPKNYSLSYKISSSKTFMAPFALMSSTIFR